VPKHDDDEQFEIYLRQFRPREPEPLPNGKRVRLTRRAFAMGACAAVAAVAIVVVLTMGRGAELDRSASSAERGLIELASIPQPLTIRKANALVAHAPSLQAAMDLMAFHPQSAAIPKNQQSALFVLSKEKN
jgi:hypothetical protein